MPSSNEEIDRDQNETRDPYANINRVRPEDAERVFQMFHNDPHYASALLEHITRTKPQLARALFREGHKTGLPPEQIFVAGLLTGIDTPKDGSDRGFEEPSQRPDLRLVDESDRHTHIEDQ